VKEALYYKTVKGEAHCLLCPQFCVIPNGARGKCHARTNIGGKLYSLVYDRPCSISVDPIEKKPLHHFLPGTFAYSFATPGCNLSCKFCQNWEISQAFPEAFPTREVTAEEIVKGAIESKCASIAYTYTEPTIFFEYMLDVAKLAKKRKIRNVTVTNGYINPAPAEELYKLIDATNIDIKGMSDKFYKEVCGARLQPVLDAVKQIHEMGVWVEITNLVIPTKNDTPAMIRKLCKWMIENVGPDVPLHFSRFFPHYKMSSLPITPLETLSRAEKIAREEGINYVYVGNIPAAIDTYCRNCGRKLMGRVGYSVTVEALKNGKCGNCGAKIPGVWK